MTDDTPELEPAVTFDSRLLIAQVRRGDPAAIEEAYRLTFGTGLGRTVLLHLLASLGRIGEPRGPETIEQANHTNGRGQVALEIARLAGFDATAVAAAGLTQMLEGARYEHEYGSSRPGNPDVRFGDEVFDGGANSDGQDFDP